MSICSSAVLRCSPSNQENVTEISHWPDYRGSAQATLSNNLGGGEFDLAWAMPRATHGESDLLDGFPLPAAARAAYTIAKGEHPSHPLQRHLEHHRRVRHARPASTACRFDAACRAYDQDRSVAGSREAGARHHAAAGVDEQLPRDQRLHQLRSDASFPRRVFHTTPTNSGDRSRNAFSVVPEIAFDLALPSPPPRPTSATRSYTTMWRSRTADQPQYQSDPGGGQGEPTSPVMLVGAAQPSFGFNTSDFWAQTLRSAWRTVSSRDLLENSRCG